MTPRRMFLVDLERVVEINAPSDQHAAVVAEAIDAAVDMAILAVNVGNREIAEKHTQAYRGKSGIRVWDSDDVLPVPEGPRATMGELPERPADPEDEADRHTTG